ncbi:MAG: DNA methylase, partial [Bacteroidaceae bacterium]|nr:DNA methylase [Bacteroidaceae bacterium]
MQENTELRRELNEKYDEFYKEFGPLNYTANKYHVEQLKVNDLLGLEIHGDNGMWQKADILLKPVAFATDDLHEADTAQEALAQSLNDYGKPDMQYMMAMTGKTEEEILDELHDEVFYNPLNDEFEIMAKFICGDVISKAEQIKALNHSNPSRSNYSELVKHSLAVLEAAAPEPIPFDELDFNLGERWVSPEIYGRFASEFFSMPEDDSWRGGAVNVTVRYDRMLDQYAVTADTYNQKIWTQYSVKSEATSSIDGMGMLVHALHNTCPKMMKYQRDEDGCRIKDASDKGWLKEEDSEATQLANTKVEEIRQGYVDWLLRQPQEFRDELADKYNRKFNCFVKPKYDGSHQKFPGLSRENLAKDIKGFKDLYQSQKDCIWMLVLNGGGICDHEVGGGKTLIMCVAAHEMKRLGLAHKPMIIGLKANVDEIARTYKTAYPQAKVLYASAKDYSASERVDFFNRMKNNDWDCVIMSHDQFGRIPQSDEVQMELLADEVRQIDESLAALNGMEWKITNQLRKGLERRKRNKEAE